MKKREYLIVATMAFLLVCGGLSTVQATETQVAPVQTEEYELPWMSLHMGTIISGKVYGSSEEEVLKLRQMVEDEIVRYEDMMSVHKKTALNEVNDRSGEWVSVPQEVAEMTREALEVAKDSNQAFEPTIGPVVNLMRQFRRLCRRLTIERWKFVKRRTVGKSAWHPDKISTWAGSPRVTSGRNLPSSFVARVPNMRYWIWAETSLHSAGSPRVVRGEWDCNDRIKPETPILPSSTPRT